MEEVTLQQLLEAGCHFGHKAERWHPAASDYIYIKKDGIHIIDLVKTKTALDAAMKYVADLTSRGEEIIFVGTKRQAKGIIKELSVQAGAYFFVERWIGGFLTNWDEIKKNIQKANDMTREKQEGAWKKYPKHEQVRLGKLLDRLILYYEGVLTVKKTPAALFIVDIKKEIAAVREAVRCGIPVVAIVDTNVDARQISYPIPANDDAVGSIKIISLAIAGAYEQGKKQFEKNQKDGESAPLQPKKEDVSPKAEVKQPEKKKKAMKVRTKKTETEKPA